MQNKADARINDDLLKSLFLQILPTNVQQILAISNDNLDKLAEMADGIMSTSSAPVVNAIAASADQPDLHTMLCEITFRLEARTRDQSRGRNQTRSANRSRETENPEHCWYHRKFEQQENKMSTPMCLPDGKLLVPSSRKRGDGETMIQRLYLTDKTPSSRYLIETGVDVFVASHSAHKTSGQAAQMQLFAANGTAIPTYGNHLLKLDLGLRRKFNWPFIIASVSQPIIGQSTVEFLRHLVSAKGITPLPDKVTAIVNFPQPVTVIQHLANWSSVTDRVVHDILHVKGIDNVVSDTLSRINIATIETPSHIDFQEIANNQKSDKELSEIVAHPDKSFLVLQPFPMGDHAIELYCDVASNRIRQFVPEVDRKNVFSSLHSISHSGIKATVKLVKERYVWPGIKVDVRTWPQQCLVCQRSKIARHTQSKLGAFIPSNAGFEHIHIHIVGLLPPSEDFRYCLTCVDRFSKWPEAYPLVDISASTVVSTFYNGWVSRFGLPLRITIGQGTQFEASLFEALSKFLVTAVIEQVPTTPLEMAKAAWKEEPQATTAEILYGTPIRPPGEFLSPLSNTTDSAAFVGKLRETMQELLPLTHRQAKTCHHTGTYS
ncbi:reverse transcriptase [Caerostris darwini]|uniref:RNA-directed DNA polymerase n=1 Tax=Caerostris darwini TaxID=1538125 RepID=A0AAV4T022_9ARAC|nr:reverse transcriptase [Caerostris darwini]